MSDFAPTSPQLPVDPGIVKTHKAFSDALTLDLTDDQIKRFLSILLPIKKKWEERFKRRFSDTSNFTPEEALELVDKMEEEIKYELATRMDMFVEMDATPIFEGQPPIIEVVGALASHESAKFGMDHEKKTWEVQKAKDKGEDFLGQRDNPDSAKAKRRSKG